MYQIYIWIYDSNIEDSRVYKGYNRELLCLSKVGYVVHTVAHGNGKNLLTIFPSHLNGTVGTVKQNFT